MSVLNLKFVKQMTGASIQELLFNAAKESMGLDKGKTVLHFSKEEITNLPKIFQDLTTGLKNPAITIGNKTAKGQSLWGLAVRDGEKSAEKFALSLDGTRGEEPVYQFRHQIFQDGKKFFGEHHNMDLSVPEIKSEATISSFTTRDGLAELSVENDKFYSLNRQLNIEGACENINSERSKDLYPIKMVEELQEELKTGKIAERIDLQKTAFHTATQPILKKISEISTMNLKTVEQELIKHKNKADSFEKEMMDMYAELKGLPKEELNLRSVASDIFDAIIMHKVDENGQAVFSIPNEIINKFVQFEHEKSVLYALSSKKAELNHIPNISDSRIAEILKEINAKVPKYRNKTTIKKLKELKDKSKTMSQEDVTKETVNIICKELGLNPKLLKTEFDKSVREVNGSMVFDYVTYSLKIDPDCYLIVDFDDYVSLIRHELQHAVDYGQLAKNKGLSNFGAIVRLKAQKREFNENTWEKVLKQTKTGKIGLRNREHEFLYYSTPDIERSLNDIAYYNNLYETRAYREQFAMITALRGKVTNSNSVHQYIDTILAKELCSKLNKIYQLYGENKEKTLTLLNSMLGKSISTTEGVDTGEYRINQWRELARLLDEKIAELEKAKSMNRKKLNVQM